MKVTLLLLAVLLPSPLLAQGLGDTAARERQKRAEKPSSAPAKVFTDQDLPAPAAPEAVPNASGQPKPAVPGSSGQPTPVIPRDSGVPGPEESAAPADASAAEVDPLEKERQERKLLEAEWRVRFANAREQLAIAEANSWREVVRTQFYQGIPVQMRVKEQVETEELEQARKALADLTEEFRRTGFPPGWSRE
ncbi:MAG TPA: hypothetical protein VE359_00610 [Vicinamibacteria bacterium]|nr:hypothetical protein [Vicinamibacteria bacterium]